MSSHGGQVLNRDTDKNLRGYVSTYPPPHPRSLEGRDKEEEEEEKKKKKTPEARCPAPRMLVNARK